jgi:zinc/manganese transport system substrate-binding protein
MSSRPSKQPKRVLVALLATMITIGGCGADPGSGDDGILVVATNSILADIASNVVGEEGAVEFLIPLGGDSHDFSPSARQVARLSEADLILANGLSLEESMADVLDSLRADGARVVELAPLVDPIPFTGEGHDDDGHEDETEDPHFWMDPIRVGEAALALADELDEAGPGGAWHARAEGYADEMRVTDTAIAGRVGDVAESSRKMVTNHEAFGYFAARYGFEVVGAVIPGGSTLAEPSSAELADLVELMQDEGVNVIFAETSRPTTLADAVAAELGEEVEVVELFTESLGPAGSGAETLSKMLLTNAERITAALG